MWFPHPFTPQQRPRTLLPLLPDWSLELIRQSMEFERDAGELGGRRHWARYRVVSVLYWIGFHKAQCYWVNLPFARKWRCDIDIINYIFTTWLNNIFTFCWFYFMYTHLISSHRNYMPRRAISFEWLWISLCKREGLFATIGSSTLGQVGSWVLRLMYIQSHQHASIEVWASTFWVLLGC